MNGKSERRIGDIGEVRQGEKKLVEEKCICASPEAKECVFGVCPMHGFTITKR